METNIVLGTLMYRIKVDEVPERLTFNQTQYNFGPFSTPALVGKDLGTVSARNSVNPDNPNPINYAFATGTPADTITNLTIHRTTGAISPRQDITDAGSYTFMVTASQQGAINISSGPVNINFLSQDVSNDLGLISQCSSTPTSSTPAGTYTVNNLLPIKEYSTTKCNFKIPRNMAIDNAFLSNPDNLAVNITVDGMLSIFPAGSITLTDGSDATVAPNPLADADGMLITNINLTLAPADDASGDAILIFTTYNNLTNTVLGTLSYPINVMPVDDAPNFPDAAYSFTTIAIGLKGKVLGRVEATIPADNPNQADPSYAFAADNGAADDNFTIDASTGDIALKRSLVPEDVGDYVFNVIANQTGTAGEYHAEVIIRILPIDGDEDGDGFTNAYDAVPDDAAVNVSGTGTPTDPYIISNIYQLQAIDGTDHNQTLLTDNDSATGGNWLYGANRTAQLGSSYKLSNDIDAVVVRYWNGGRGFNPIGDCGGNNCSAEPVNPFTGVLNGTGYAVHNLEMTRDEDGTTKGSIGLFAIINDANIMNLGLENMRINMAVSNTLNILGIGGLAGWMRGITSLNNVYVTGIILLTDNSESGNAAATTHAGGLIGLAQVAINIRNSYTIVIFGIRNPGGLVGFSTLGGEVSRSYSLNKIGAGGLIGSNEGTLNIYSSYTVSNSSTPDVLSLVGFSDRKIYSNASYWFNETDGSVNGVTSFSDDSSKGLSAAQLQNCGLDGFRFDGAADEVCEGLFPSGTATDPLWGNRTEDGVTTYWDFAHADEYPYLLATDGEDRNLLPTVAEQRCQHNLFFYDLPCTEGL